MRRALPLLFLPALLLAQGRGVPPAELLKPLGADWLTYNGDYSGRRFSSLNLINKSNVKGLSLAWMLRLPEAAANGLIADLNQRINDAVSYAREHFEDAPEIRNWRWA